MKKLYIFLAVLLFTTSIFAQAPEKMSYQAVVRDSGDVLVTNQLVGMQISILQGSASGTAVYTETQTPTTNINGLVSLEIGTGTTTDDFTAIDWATGPYFIKTETDPLGGSSYTITGTSQLLSVPYALYAKTAGSVTETQTLEDVVALGNNTNSQIKNVTDPTDAQDAATKSYVDASISALPQTGIIIFKANGTFIVPNGVNYITVRMWSAGGGGARRDIQLPWDGNLSSPKTAGGGGSGSYFEGIIGVTPGESLSINVGTGGTAATVNNGSGGNGGSSSVSFYATAFGGSGSSGANPGGGSGGYLPYFSSDVIMVDSLIEGLRGEDGGFGAVGDGGLLPNGTQLGKGGRGGNMFSSNTFQYPPESGSDGMIIIQY